MFLAGVASGVTVSTAGCIGGGGKVVKNVQQSYTIQPGQGKVFDIPDVSDPGGAIQYRAKAGQPFDVYFFTSEDQWMAYDAYTDGDDPSNTPAGNTDIGGTAKEVATGTYKAQTKNEGGRQPISATGPYWFVIDHSDYRGETAPGEEPSPLEVFLNLTVSKRRFGI